jgi:cytochrome c peroxidase
MCVNARVVRLSILTTVAMSAFVVAVNVMAQQGEVTAPQMSAVGDPDLLRRRYQEWKQKIRDHEGKEHSTLSLISPTSHSTAHSEPHGRVVFDFATGRISAEVFGLSAEPPLELWLTNGARLFSAPDGGAVWRVGSFRENGDRAVLDESIASLLNAAFEIEQVIVAPASSDPLQSALLVGSPSLFQRLYAAEQSAISGGYWAPGSFRAMIANEPTGFPDVFDDLVTEGEDLFFNETFDGNGRSCGTCHPATNNFTIDAEFIASLPSDDPLFVAQSVPALIFGNPANLDSDGNPRRFENPALMRAFGLIVENQDGMEDLQNRFNMRSVPHNIGMSVSVAAPTKGPTPPDERTGWSGDGAPSGVVGGVPASGRVRDFILGAIVQHYPLTMDRSFVGDHPDFRVATEDELDALEAFLLSVGRQEELELRERFPGELVLKDPDAEAGKRLFRGDESPPNTPTCMGCHGNAGANVLPDDPVNPTNNFGNRNFNTGVELFLQNRTDDPEFTVIGEPRPVDGGFGTNPAGDFTSLEAQPGSTNENFGDRSFNTASLVEAADTPPFFHNNIIDNLEDAIRFYNSKEFMDPDGDGMLNRENGIAFNETEVMQVASFLRVINAIDNIENSALRSSDRALEALDLEPNPDDVIKRILEIGVADTDDAIRVLNEGGLHNSGGLPSNAVKQLERAKTRLQQAMNPHASDKARTGKLVSAKKYLQDALEIMRE